ncbi:hypothetical protein JTB14_035664 [Gonioctena quinquepunctata]|nr:hypothetical protein JTB14_035664 [Gonioctena quinquepunctata]
MKKNQKKYDKIRGRGYSVAALLAILFALPFAWRVLVHREHGHWGHPLPAFYFAHLELFLGNGCLGIGVMMLLALTLERYVSVCHPGHARPILGSPIRAVTLIPLSTFIFYIPTLFRSQVKTCKLLPETILLYQRIEDTEYINHPIYSVYKVVLELIFKVIPVILLAALNLRILVVYRRSCERRRKMTLSRKCSGEEDPRKFAEERRLVLLLGSTSILFLICVTPMVVLNVTLSEANLIKYPYQVNSEDILSCGHCSRILGTLSIIIENDLTRKHHYFDEFNNINVDFETHIVVGQNHCEKNIASTSSAPPASCAANIGAESPTSTLTPISPNSGDVPWNETAIKLLIQTYISHKEKFSSPLFTKIKVWNIITKDLEKFGLNKNGKNVMKSGGT